MSGATVAEFLAYWEDEGATYARNGDYAWMASLVPGKRVLEVGCGPGFGTQALVDRGFSVLAVDVLAECLALTRARVGDAAQCLQADLMALDETANMQLAAFAPESVVCWLMGAPAESTGASMHDGGQAVAAYREKIHRKVAELAASLPTVRALHLVDRTAIPWQAKDIGRQTLVSYHAGKTLAGLPFMALPDAALYRKLGASTVDMARMRKMHPSIKGVVPTLASLLVQRNH